MLVARIKFKLPCRQTLQSPCEELLNGTLVTGIGARYNKTGPQALCFSRVSQARPVPGPAGPQIMLETLKLLHIIHALRLKPFWLKLNCNLQ